MASKKAKSQGGLVKSASTAEMLAEYDRKLHNYEALRSKCQQLMGELLTAEKIQVLSITSRIKSAGSLTEKLSRPGKHYHALKDVTDIAGLRVVTYFEDDVDKVAKLVEREFSLIREHCIDKRAYVEPDRFGYRSLHYVCCLSKPRSLLTENAGFCGELFEVQIRSVLQHAWAEIEHDLGYKGAVTIPAEIKRQLSRVAGLLEIADRDFREVRDRSAAYRQRVAEEIQRNEMSQIALDSVSLMEFISTSPLVKQLDEAIRVDLGYEIEPDSDHETTLEMLHFVKIDTVEQLRSALEKNLTFLRHYAQRMLDGHFVSKEGIKIGSGLSVFHLPQVLAARRGVDKLAQMFKELFLGPSNEERTEAEEVVAVISEIDKKMTASKPRRALKRT